MTLVNVPANVYKLALTAASPLWRGYIADVDARWNVVAGSVDDRTEEERGLKVWVSWCETRSDSHQTIEIEGEQVSNSEIPIRLGIAVYFRQLDESTRV